MKKIYLIILIFVSFQATAQIKKVTLQASGLTCSMCSKSIYKALVAVPFVQDVQSDIKNSAFIISFKENESVDFDPLKKAVTDAGFSVASFKMVANFTKQDIINDTHVIFDNKTLHFLNVQPQNLEGGKTVLVVDKNFVTAKDQKKYSKLTTMKCYETGVTESCCTKTNTASTRVYHVTIL
jgi:copper chaperone CopZ